MIILVYIDRLSVPLSLLQMISSMFLVLILVKLEFVFSSKFI